MSSLREMTGAPSIQLVVDRHRVANRTRLEYQLHSDDSSLGLFKCPFGTVWLEQEPQEYFGRLLHDIGALDDDLGAESEAPIDPMDRLRSWGAKLFKELLPERLRLTLWSLLDRGVRYLEIISDEPSIPWEIFRFHGREADRYASGPFFGEAFILTRWIKGMSSVDVLPWSRVAVVQANDRELPSGRKERDFLQALNGPSRLVEDVRPRYVDLQNSLGSSAYEGIHFICHGSASRSDADTWPLHLEDHRELIPADLEGEAARWCAAHPLVFLNACEVGQSGLSIAGVGGWAMQFLEAGAGAFIGPMWSVRDSRASLFAESFYRAFLQGVSVGHATFQARERLRMKFPQDLTWLAYTVFARPNAVCRNGSEKAHKEAFDGKQEVLESSEPLVEVQAMGVASAPALRVEPKSQRRVHEMDGTELLFVPGGYFHLGTDDLDKWSRPMHRVRLTSFWIGKFPITNAQYGRFLEDHPDRSTPSFWQDPQFNQPDQPVVGVSWDEAQAYCRWAGLRLPSEAQWEAAARGRRAQAYPWGENPPTDKHANFDGHVGKTTSVDTYPAGEGPYGTFDQVGNVWEWCSES